MSFIYALEAAWTDNAEIFNGLALDISDGLGGSPNYAAGSMLMKLSNNTVNKFTVAPDGVTNFSIQSSATGGKVRTFASKLNETISVTDFDTLQEAITAATGKRLLWPAGTYSIPAAGLTGVSNTEWVGDGEGVTILQLAGAPTGIGVSMALFFFQDNIIIRDMTIDFNLKTGVPASCALTFQGCTNFHVVRCAFKNFDIYSLAIINSVGFHVDQNYFRRATLVNTPNAGILVVSSGAPSSHGWITNNYLENTSMSLDLSNSIISGNRVVYFRSGGGIYFNPNATYCFSNIIEGNIVSNATGLDSLGFACAGIECWAPRSTIKGNIVYDVSGGAIQVGGQGCLVVDNQCFNNGTYGIGFGMSGIVVRNGVSPFNGSYSHVAGNICYDTSGAAGTQKYGYEEESALLTDITLGDNHFFTNTLADTLILSATTQSRLYGTLRLSQTPSAIGTGVKTVSNAADGTTNFGHYLSINMNGTLYYIPCSAVAPT